MRRLTFRGYLQSYVRYLAGRDTLALSQLVALSESEPRLTEPLMLWATVTGSSARLSKMLEGQDDRELELSELVSLQQSGHLESALEDGAPQLRSEYLKVWRSYVARRDAPSRDAYLKSEARSRVLALEAVKDVSRYRMAKDLGLNPGNLHAFLAQGRVEKLSLDRAFALLSYLEAA
jgi:hypothetical protein